MENYKRKGKAIANEFDGKHLSEGIRNQSGRDSIAREINLPNPSPYGNNLALDPSPRRVMTHGGLIPKEINLLPLASRNFVGSGQNSNIQRERDNFPTRTDISWISPQHDVDHNGGGASAQGASIFRGYVASEMTTNYFKSFISSSNPVSIEGSQAENYIESQAPIEERSLYITFSHGKPLTNAQVFWFLALKYGIKNLLEVDIHEPKRGPVHFGRLVFTTPTIPMMILNGREEASMEIYGKSMICKKYVPKKHRIERDDE